MTLAFTNARVFDGKSEVPLTGATVVVEDGKVGRVGTSQPVPPGADVIDLHGQTLMPGLMDAHVHLTMDTLCGKNITWHHLALHPSLRAYHALANAQKALNAGFTTLRTMQAGGPDMGGDAALHDAIELGITAGPRIIPSAMIFGMTGGHNDMFVPAVFKDRWATADGVDECRKAARTAIRAGAEFLKIFTSGGVFSMKTSPDARNYTLEEIEAICDEATSQGRRVAAHAIATQGIKNAIIGGVTTVEHGTKLDQEAVNMMLDRGTYYVPTLAIGNSFRTGDPHLPEHARLKGGAGVEQHYRSVRMAAEAGVKIVLGTDASDFAPFGRNALELELLVEAGVLPIDALRAGTSTAAEALGVDKFTGSIEPGKSADLLIVDGDPLADVRILQDLARIKRVYLAGRLVVDRDSGLEAYVEGQRLQGSAIGEPHFSRSQT
ncbi:MAG: amidohydrolase family protein [Chloroflexi bacterium]|nr:amidohydrolase family protein [Chloroflexota bacterium]